MLYELRYYYIHAGRMKEFLELMESLIIPFQLSQGMIVLGSFLNTDNENCYIWLRRYNDENDKQRLYDRVYGSDYWKNDIRPKMAGMIVKEKTQVTMLKPTAGSILQ
jgi:hypothetical protein